MSNNFDKGKQFKLYNYVEPELATDRYHIPTHIIIPENLSTDLYPNKTMELGERIATTWYSSYENGEFSDPIVKMEYQFDRDSEGLLTGRKITLNYMLKDGTWSEETKSRYKYVINTDDKLREIKQRRNNIVNDCKARAADFGISGAIGQLFDTFLAEIALYQESGSPKFRDALKVESREEFSWLDTELDASLGGSIRNLLVFMFSIGVNEPKSNENDQEGT